MFLKKWFILGSFLFVSQISIAQIFGCTDSLAINYDAMASQNDGSCIYSVATISPDFSSELDSCIRETSGLTQWNNQFWTHNDNSDTAIYSINPSTGAILQRIPIPNIANIDWEEISQDENYFYIGDFGNNATGNRTDLKILRVYKPSLSDIYPQVESISFSYSNQTDFSNQGANNTNFDCEAFIVGEDSLFLFTKRWIDLSTSVFSIPKLPGDYIATPIDSFSVNGLITGATLIGSKNLVILSGYSKQLAPFIYLLYDFRPNRFFSGNKRKIEIALPYHQIEGISTMDGTHLFCTNEHFSYLPAIDIPQKIHQFNLSPFLGNYLSDHVLTIKKRQTFPFVYPNPVITDLNLGNVDFLDTQTYQIINQQGAVVKTGILQKDCLKIEVSQLSPGLYFFNILSKKPISIQFLKKQKINQE